MSALIPEGGPSAAALIAGSASNAGFVGWVGVARNAPGAQNYVMVDIFAGVSNASDRFLSVSGMTITTTAIGGFFQSSDPASKAFRPDTENYSASRNSVDSFVTAAGKDGHVGKNEQARIQRKEDRQSGAIYKKKHNAIERKE